MTPCTLVNKPCLTYNHTVCPCLAYSPTLNVPATHYSKISGCVPNCRQHIAIVTTSSLTLIDYFHIVHSVHCTWFTNPCCTNTHTVPLLCTSFTISSYMLWLNYHHHLHISKVQTIFTVFKMLQNDTVMCYWL